MTMLLTYWILTGLIGGALLAPWINHRDKREYDNRTRLVATDSSGPELFTAQAS
jgi:hypothetical protein